MCYSTYNIRFMLRFDGGLLGGNMEVQKEIRLLTLDPLNLAPRIDSSSHHLTITTKSLYLNGTGL